MRAGRASGLLLAATLAAAPLNASWSAAPIAWQDNATGLAIGGYDAVAYYVAALPKMGAAGYEFAWRDVVFRFSNIGNLQAFARHPAVYAPQFSGFDPYAASLGIAVEGQPTIWAIHRERLYLFESIENRARWAKEPDAVLVRARALWPALAARLPSLP